MKRFLTLTCFMAVLVLLCFTLAFLCIPAGMIDDVYPRISSPRAGSLVIGTSRAAQAVDPGWIHARLRGFYPERIYNFAFHLDLSSYNEDYERMISQKLPPPDGKTHCFILAVDPWMLGGEPPRAERLRLHSVSSRPNVEYLIRHFSRSWFSPLLPHSYVNPDGRTEVHYTPKSQREWERRMKGRLKNYEERAARYTFNDAQAKVLLRIIRKLKQRGDVFLVRIPVSKPLLDIENRVCPDFSGRMENIAGEEGAAYLDFSRQPYQTTDGNHLTFEEGNRFSEALADSMAKRLTKPSGQ